MRIKLLFAIAFFLTNTCHAALLNFEEVPIGPASVPIESQGFRFSSGFWEIAVLDQTPYAGTRSLFMQGYTTMLIDRPDGEAFSLASVVGLYDQDIDVIATGYFGDGTSISTRIGNLTSLDANLVYGDVNGSTLRMYQFGQEWTGLASVRLTQTNMNTGAYQFDNFVMTAVPLPASAWLYCSGIAALVWLKRRRA